MRYSLLLLMAGALLSSCSAKTQRLLQEQPTTPALPKQATVVLPDSLPKRRLFGLLPAKKVASDNMAYSMLPSKLKNSTIIIQTGDGNAAGVAGKKATGPTQATDSGTINTAGPGSNLAQVVGDGNQLKQKAEAPLPVSGGWPWWKWLGIGTVAGFALRQFGPWLLRRISPLSTL